MTEPGRRRLGAHTVNSNYTRIHGALGVLRFHHENLHLPRAEAPEWIAFGCLEAPERGGETGIVNTASAYDDLPDGLKDKLLSFSQQFELRIPSSSWKSELDADDEAGAVDVCSKLGYRVLRASATELVVSFERPCVETHRFTGRRSIFLDRSSYGMPSEFAMTFRECYGAGWTWFRALQGVMQPYEVLRAGYRFYQTHVRRRWVALARDERAELSRACAAHVAAVRYEPGDVLLADNLLVEHTALPWTGGRKIAVAMGAYGPTAAPWSEMPDAA